MYSRRLLRVKALQALYAYEINALPLGTYDNVIKKSVGDTFAQYIYLLHLLTEIAGYAQQYHHTRESRNVQSEADLRPVHLLAANPFIEAILKHEAYQKALKTYSFGSLYDRDFIKQLFGEISDKTGFVSYINQKNPSIEEHHKVVKLILKRSFLENETFWENISEHFTCWDDDGDVVVNKFATSLNEFFEGFPRPLHIFPFNLKEAEDFTLHLFHQVALNDEALQKIISPKYKNWEEERVNKIDTILLKLALAELLYFPEIPSKVSINEYVEISKEYSTPKSKDFLNGILDVLMKELEREGKIKKAGRGLR